MNIQDLEISVKKMFYLLAIEGEKFLHEASLLTLLQMSGSQVIFL